MKPFNFNAPGLGAAVDGLCSRRQHTARFDDTVKQNPPLIGCACGKELDGDKTYSEHLRDG